MITAPKTCLGLTRRWLLYARDYHTGGISQIGYPIPNKEPKWVTAEEAVKCVKSENVVFCHGAAATPHVLMEALVDYGQACCLSGISVCHMHTENEAKWAEPAVANIFRSVSFFMGGNVRAAVAEGRGDNISVFLHEIPKIFKNKVIVPDVAFIHVSPPDNHGYCSLGTSVDCTPAACNASKMIVAQVNPHMPRTFGDSHIHVSHIDYAVCVDTPLPEHKDKPLTDNDRKIASLIAEQLVEDGATLQMGIGTIPDAVLASLLNHKNLGIHSEMFAAGVIDLVEKGCVTNDNKTLFRGRTIGSFINGNKRLYDWVNDNPSVEMLRVEYVNDPSIIAKLPKMTAINSAVEIDLTGQVNSDSIGTRFYSGFGGQVDFIKGAGAGLDGRGKPIIALESKTDKGVSKIVPLLKPGAGVVTTRAHVNYVVTENGIANLFGKTMRQRAYELIKIAHPDNRQELEKAARDRLKIQPSPSIIVKKS